MPNAISVHIGLNHVDPGSYGGWDGTLAGCVNDAHDLATIAMAEGFRSSVLVDRQATAAGVVSSIRTAANRLRAGDIFMLTFAGHGGQVVDTDETDQPRGFDETWACWDRQLLDDEVHAALAEFARDVRVVVISDSCHSGTLMRNPLSPSPPVRTLEGARRARVIPAAVANADAIRRHITYTRARRNARAELRRAMAALHTLNRRQATLRKPTACIAARVVFFAGCQDNEVAYDGPGNGAFTTALLTTWNGGRFDGTYPGLVSAVRARLVTQTPNYLAVGLGDSAWEATRPLTVDISDDLEPIDDPDGAQLQPSS
jgi:metacaspase-1